MNALTKIVAVVLLLVAVANAVFGQTLRSQRVEVDGGEWLEAIATASNSRPRVEILITKAGQSENSLVASTDLQDVHLFSADGTAIEFRDVNPDTLIAITWGGDTISHAVFELRNDEDLAMLARVIFKYRGMEHEFGPLVEAKSQVTD